MIIGFRTDMTTIIETLSTLSIGVHSRITSELDYDIIFRHIQRRDINVATVETADLIDPIFDSNFDARFGDRRDPNNSLDILETVLVLEKGRLVPRIPLVTTIFRDFRPERNECFIINILTRDTDGDVTFMCNENADNPDDFFCDHTICILDNDGLLKHNRLVDKYTCALLTCLSTCTHSLTSTHRKIGWQQLVNPELYSSASKNCTAATSSGHSNYMGTSHTH